MRSYQLDWLIEVYSPHPAPGAITDYSSHGVGVKPICILDLVLDNMALPVPCLVSQCTWPARLHRTEVDSNPRSITPLHTKGNQQLPRYYLSTEVGISSSNSPLDTSHGGKKSKSRKRKPHQSHEQSPKRVRGLYIYCRGRSIFSASLTLPVSTAWWTFATYSLVVGTRTTMLHS